MEWVARLLVLVVAVSGVLLEKALQLVVSVNRMDRMEKRGQLQ